MNLKHYIFLLFITIGQISFAQNVKAKWIFTKSDAMNCDDCKDNHPDCCVFRFNGVRYERQQSYIFNSKGLVDSIYSYHVPLGVNIYSINVFKSIFVLRQRLEYIGAFFSDYKVVKKLKVYYNSKIKKLYENGLKVENLILKDKKLIYSNVNDLIIYELK